MKASSDEAPADALTGSHVGPLPMDPEERLGRIEGVVRSGILWNVTTGGLRAVWSERAVQISVLAASASALDVIGPRFSVGRGFDRFHDSRGEAVVVLSRSAATQLGIEDVALVRSIFLGDRPFTVIGIFESTKRRPEALLEVIIPAGAALAGWASSADQPAVVIETRPGAAHVVAAQAPIALRPESPELLQAVAPPDPRTLRNQVDDEVTGLFLVLAAVSVVIGAFGIANSTLVSVLERVPEIGVRRAVGARRHHIALQFLVEGGCLGTMGGLIGASIGLIVVVAVAVSQTWTATMDVGIAFVSPVVGGVTGLVAPPTRRGEQPPCGQSRLFVARTVSVGPSPAASLFGPGAADRWILVTKSSGALSERIRGCTHAPLFQTFRRCHAPEDFGSGEGEPGSTS